LKSRSFSKPKPNPAKPAQDSAKPGKAKAKENAWISLDFLCRFETFQALALTPRGKNIFSRRAPTIGREGQGVREERKQRRHRHDPGNANLYSMVSD
jgi:hypothetical protein